LLFDIASHHHRRGRGGPVQGDRQRPGGWPRLRAWNGWPRSPTATTWTGRPCRKCTSTGRRPTAASAGRGHAACVPGHGQAVDAGIKIYNAYKLAEAIENGDDEAIKQYSSEILIDTAVDAAPLGAMFTKLGMTKVGVLIAGLGAKVGDNVATVLTKVEDIARYAVKKGKLPDNYITKAEALKLGWKPKAGNLDKVAPGKSIGGDIFRNREGGVPDAPGRTWIEADINYTGGYRGSERLLISSDGLVYKTTDHYKTFSEVIK